jgi:hypothetical protein
MDEIDPIISMPNTISLSMAGAIKKEFPYRRGYYDAASDADLRNGDQG